ncbi:hypothetical protein IAU59_003571 [Kwoniella sp. CBS 9459]
MSGCSNGIPIVEEVRLTIIHHKTRLIPSGSCPDRKWEGCISAYSQLKDIFDRWAREAPGVGPVGHYRFRLNAVNGRILTGEETCRSLGIHSGTKIYAIARIEE